MEKEAERSGLIQRFFTRQIRRHVKTGSRGYTMWWKVSRIFDRLEQMTDQAAEGTFLESDYNETRLSRLESKWAAYLGKAALDQARLRKEKERVESLVSDISHQIKTPMTNIRLYASLLEESLADQTETDRNLDMLNEIIRQADKMEFLIRALTAVSRLESGLVKVVPEKSELSVLLAEAASEIRPAASRKQIRIENHYNGKAEAYFDRKWTKEALVNVLDNAVKYSPAGTKVLLSVQEYQMYHMISVKDHGIGIPEEEQPEIFARFYRSPRVQREEGVGIGLYLTREILKKENGYMKVRSSPGEGAEFMLFLYRQPPFSHF